MKILMLAVLFSGGWLFAATAWTQYGPDAATGIEFTEGTWNEIVTKARGENKTIFLDIYATWCGPCKMLQHNTFSDADVGTYFNAHFVNVSLDGEKGEGHLLAKKYQVHAYPTMLFIKADGSVKEAAVGYHSPKQLLKIAANIVN